MRNALLLSLLLLVPAVILPPTPARDAHAPVPPPPHAVAPPPPPAGRAPAGSAPPPPAPSAGPPPPPAAPSPPPGTPGTAENRPHSRSSRCRVHRPRAPPRITAWMQRKRARQDDSTERAAARACL